MQSAISQSIILLITVLIAFLFGKKLPYELDLQLSGLLFIVYFVAKKFTKFLPSDYRIIDAVVFSLIILMIVLSSGGASSPFFFLCYFLLFALSLLLHPLVSMTTGFAIALFFLFDVEPGSSLGPIVPILSLPFLTPFALFMGNEYRKNLKQKKVINTLVEHQTELKENSMMFLTLVIKSHIKTIRNFSENFSGDHELEEIKKTTRRIEKLIEKYEEGGEA
ncbi:hypothetical protein A3D06_00160 [Candidatus Roizmanbacteria bacterium RIFCSPHIGHO2_02_FULL_40_9]|nr:MAG: hypothetical protein A3D06_00160 [Candidatus Roizmanbacteria bacterium RIFCSPHIGHO2_02_FULL_40_9]